MKCEEILKVVNKVWKSKDDAVTISRGLMSHHQVMAAAYEMDGDNAYLTQNYDLDFGIRLNFYPNEDITGVVRVAEFKNPNTPAQQIANERIRKGLKHKVPSILKLNLGKLTDEQIGFLLVNLDHNYMDDKFVNFGIV